MNFLFPEFDSIVVRNGEKMQKRPWSLPHPTSCTRCTCHFGSGL